MYLIHTIVIELYPLYQTLEGPSMYLPTHKATNTMPSIEQWYRSKYVFIDTQSYQTLYSLPNNGRSKYVFIETQSYQTLSSLPNTGRSKYVFIHTQSYQTLSPLSNNGIGLSMHLSTHKAIRLYTLYRAVVNRVYIQLTMFRYKSKDKD